MTADAPGPDVDELRRRGVFDPEADDADERLELIRYVMALGAGVDDVAGSGNLGELALDLHLRPRLETTVGEVADELGIEWPRAHRLLTATGFSARRDDRVTADEAATLHLLVSSTELLGEDTTVQIARVAGNAMARVGEALVASFRLQFELPHRAAGTRDVDVVKKYAEITEGMLPEFIRTLDVLLRRQIVAVAERMWSTDDDQSAVTLPRAIGFADLVGYSTAAATMSSRQLIDVLVEFDERTASVVLGGNGQIVKTIGDEAMFVAESTADACRIALELVHAFEAGPLPPVRVGLAEGDVVSVFGDVYGPDVNLAARLVGLAEPSTVVVSEQVHARCADGFAFDRLEPVAVKGFADPVTAYRLQPMP